MSEEKNNSYIQEIPLKFADLTKSFTEVGRRYMEIKND